MQFFVLELLKKSSWIPQDDTALSFTRAALTVFKTFLTRQNFFKVLQPPISWELTSPDYWGGLKHACTKEAYNWKWTFKMSSEQKHVSWNMFKRIRVCIRNNDRHVCQVLWSGIYQRCLGTVLDGSLCTWNGSLSKHSRACNPFMKRKVLWALLLFFINIFIFSEYLLATSYYFMPTDLPYITPVPFPCTSEVCVMFHKVNEDLLCKMVYELIQIILYSLS